MTTHSQTTPRRLLEAHSIDTRDFWQRQQADLVRDGWDPTTAYLTLLLDNVGDGKPLGRLSSAALRDFGSTLEFYEGIPQLFANLQELTAEHRLSSPRVEFYVISGGLEEVIRGSLINDN